MSRLPSRAARATSSRKSRRVSVNQGGRATGAAVAAPDAEPGRRKRQTSSAGSFIGARRCGSAPKDEIHRAHDTQRRPEVVELERLVHVEESASSPTVCARTVVFIAYPIFSIF